MIERVEATRREIPVADQVVLVLVALFPIAWAPVFWQASTPRVAIVLALLPLGCVKLVRAALRGDAASRAALAFILAAAVSSSLSPAPLHSMLGSLDWWSGTIGLTAALSCWAVGRDLSSRARELLIPLLTIGALWNVLVALAQVALGVETGTLRTFPGRGSGTMLNPVYFGAFLAGVLACWLAWSRRSRWSAAVVLTLSFGVGLTGGRVPVAVVVVVAIAVIGFSETRRIAVRNAILVGAGVYAAT